MLNAMFVERVRLSGAKYIDSWDAFVDASGAYVDFGPDLTGNMRQLRLNDGVHLTVPGNQKLASLVEREIGHDLAVAQRERDVPLAGDEAEQRNVRDDSLPRGAGAAKPSAPGKSGKDAAADNGTLRWPARLVSQTRPSPFFGPPFQGQCWQASSRPRASRSLTPAIRCRPICWAVTPC